jgi:hypothetical protein
MRRVDPCLGSSLKVIFKSDDSSAKRGKMFDVHADTASVFEDVSLNAVTCGADDHVEPASLPVPPDVGWLSA